MYGNQNGSKVFTIPVEWVMTENIDIRANSLREAVDFILNNADAFPLGKEAEYVDGTWKMAADESVEGSTDEILETLESYGKGCGYGEREAKKNDKVTKLP